MASGSVPAAGFARLLDALGTDPGTADNRYHALRRKLVWFFDARGSVAPDDAADETLTRIARKLEAGECIREVESYTLGVARFVLREAGRPTPETPLLDDMPERAAPIAADDVASEVRAECMETCLEGFSAEDRELILAYYLGERRARIDARRRLADRLGIPIPALRIRAFRIRQRLHGCVLDCVARPARAMKGATPAVLMKGLVPPGQESSRR